MTYCVGIILDSGLVLASDSRTNAGVDQIGNFRKMTVFDRPGDRMIVMLSSGNLAVTQGVVALLEQRAQMHQQNIWNSGSLYEVACLVGETLREVHKRDGPYLMQHNIDAGAGFILGGQICGERHRLFNIYTEGNFIEATPDTPFCQNGEIKYGKPILDRVISYSTGLMEAAKCVLISFDSTMRSNISVGPPIDLLCYERDSLKVGLQRRLGDQDPYFDDVRRRWGSGLKRLFSELPDPHWDN
ncbi:MAG: proteasome-type protease [Nitrospira sp.]|nr:proteasome-type protease [Nitrospira sp.]